MMARFLWMWVKLVLSSALSLAFNSSRITAPLNGQDFAQIGSWNPEETEMPTEAIRKFMAQRQARLEQERGWLECCPLWKVRCLYTQWDFLSIEYSLQTVCIQDSLITTIRLIYRIHYKLINVDLIMHGIHPGYVHFYWTFRCLGCKMLLYSFDRIRAAREGCTPRPGPGGMPWHSHYGTVSYSHTEIVRH